MIERRRTISKAPIVDDSDYLTFTALENGTFTFTISKSTKTTQYSWAAYSTDGGETWVMRYNSNNYAVTITTPTISAGETVKWKGSGTTCGGRFSSSRRCTVSGNIMSMLFADNYRNKKRFESRIGSQFSSLFYGMSTLTNASELLLPVTELDDSCYDSLFMECTNLVAGPVLPAQILDKSQCYRNVFWGCSKLESIVCMATSITGYNATFGWVTGVSATGTFTKAASMTSWETGNNGIPSGWTVVDAS